MIATTESPANSKGHEQKTPTCVPTDTPVNRKRRSFLMALAGLAAGTALSGCGEQKADTRIVDPEDKRLRAYFELSYTRDRLEVEEEDLRDLLKKYPADEFVLRIVARHNGAVQEYNDAIKRYEFDKGEVAFQDLSPGKALLPLKSIELPEGYPDGAFKPEGATRSSVGFPPHPPIREELKRMEPTKLKFPDFPGEEDK